MSTIAVNQNKGFYIKELIMIVLMFAGFFIHGGALPDYGWRILFIFIGLLYGWGFVGLISPSLLGLVAMGIIGGKSTVLACWTSGFGGNVVCIIVLFSILSKWMEEIGLIKLIMNWFVSRKSLAGKPWLFIAAFFAVIFFLGFLTEAFPAILLGWACAYDLCELAGVEKRSPMMGYLIVNIAAIAAMGTYIKPWGSWGIVALGMYEQTLPGASIDFLSYLVWTTLVYVVAIALVVLAGKYLFKLDASPFENGDFSAMAKDLKFTGEQKLASIFMAVLILFLFVPAYLPKGALSTLLNKQMGLVGISVLAVAVIGMFKGADGKYIMDFKRMAKNNAIPWDPIILLTATVPLGAALRSDDAGLMVIIENFVHTHLGGLSPFIFYCVSAIFLGLLTQVAHNVVLLTAITPIFVTVSETLGFNSSLIVMIASVVLAASLGTPAASTRAGMVFGNADYVTIGDAYRFGWMSSITSILACIAVGIPLGIML